MRASADGVTIYGRDGMRRNPRSRAAAACRAAARCWTTCASAIRTGRTPVHDGRWGKATVEVALAILRSAREGREVALEHQVAVDDSSG